MPKSVSTTRLASCLLLRQAAQFSDEKKWPSLPVAAQHAGMPRDRCCKRHHISGHQQIPHHTSMQHKALRSLETTNQKDRWVSCPNDTSNVIADGNCLWRSLAYYQYGSEKGWWQVKQAIRVMSWRYRYKVFRQHMRRREARSLAHLTMQTTKSGHWATSAHILLAAHSLQVQMVIHSGSQCVAFGDWPLQWHIKLSQQHFHPLNMETIDTSEQPFTQPANVPTMMGGGGRRRQGRSLTPQRPESHQETPESEARASTSSAQDTGVDDVYLQCQAAQEALFILNVFKTSKRTIPAPRQTATLSSKEISQSL